MHLQRIKITAFRNLKDFRDCVHRRRGRSRRGRRAAYVQQPCSDWRERHGQVQPDRSHHHDLSRPGFEPGGQPGLRAGLQAFAGHRIEIKALAGKRPAVVIDGERVSAKRLSDEAREFLPSNVFVYYSGKNERIERLFQAHQRRFNQRMEIATEEYLPEALCLPAFTGQEEQAQAIAEHKRRADQRREQLGEDQLRRLFYCRGGHSQLVLLACLLSKDETFTRLLNDLNIVELESALFVLKQPHRLRGDLNERDILQGDKRFWYARGDVVNEFLDKLWQLAVAPIEHTASKLIDFRGRTEKQEQMYLFLPDKREAARTGRFGGRG